MTLPLPTSARSFFVAQLRESGASDETIEGVIEQLAEEEGLFLMTQGGSAGIAQIQDSGATEPYIISFGDCSQLGEISRLAFEVYGFNRQFEGEDFLCS